MNKLKIKKLTVILIFIICIISCCFIITACAEDDKYHAIFYDRANKWVSEDFLNVNKVYGALYDDGNPKEGDEILGVNAQRVIHYFDRTSPETRTYIIDNESQFSSIFTQYSEQIDFDKNSVILYMYCTSTIRNYRLREIKISDETAKIYYETDPKDKNRYPMINPSPRCFMVILDKVDIKSAQFIRG